MSVAFIHAICRIRRRQMDADGVDLWEGVVDKENFRKLEARHVKARLLCARCPVLEECEEYLSDLERKGKRVDGVCAGRYSDVPPRGSARACVQLNCRTCGQPMAPQAEGVDPETTHQGEGLCGNCYPLFSRKTRGGEDSALAESRG